MLQSPTKIVILSSSPASRFVLLMLLFLFFIHLTSAFTKTNSIVHHHVAVVSSCFDFSRKNNFGSSKNNNNKGGIHCCQLVKPTRRLILHASSSFASQPSLEDEIIDNVKQISNRQSTDKIFENINILEQLIEKEEEVSHLDEEILSLSTPNFNIIEWLSMGNNDKITVRNDGSATETIDSDNSMLPLLLSPNHRNQQEKANVFYVLKVAKDFINEQKKKKQQVIKKKRMVAIPHLIHDDTNNRDPLVNNNNNKRSKENNNNKTVQNIPRRFQLQKLLSRRKKSSRNSSSPVLTFFGSSNSVIEIVIKRIVNLLVIGTMTPVFALTVLVLYMSNCSTSTTSTTSIQSMISWVVIAIPFVHKAYRDNNVIPTKLSCCYNSATFINAINNNIVDIDGDHDEDDYCPI